MPDALRSTMRSFVGALVLSLLCSTTTRAQVSPSPGVATAPSTPAFLSRYDFHLAAAALSTADDHFTWDAHFGGDVDLVDYVRGRVNVLIDYDAILGKEYRPFDPYVGSYTLEASASARVGSTEFAGVFHHLSQHLSDRPKRFGIAWNVLQARMSWRLAAAGSTIDVQVGAGPIV